MPSIVIENQGIQQQIGQLRPLFSQSLYPCGEDKWKTNKIISNTGNAMKKNSVLECGVETITLVVRRAVSAEVRAATWVKEKDQAERMASAEAFAAGSG